MAVVTVVVAVAEVAAARGREGTGSMSRVLKLPWSSLAGDT